MTTVSGSERDVVKPWLQVKTLDELLKNEKEIIARIERMPNGGQLFMIHPFLLLKDIGVEVSDAAQKEILKSEPRLTGLSTVPYTALKNSKEKQNVRFHLRGLFARRAVK
jgi:hypothetical protein